ncbi:MAG TPA: hypothetical protein PK033_12580 [Acetivibrio sp.]|nr:hypothetical protein [Clostridium sp.]HOQ36865.1 hypothetical protein [Acetivibrio sp.]HPT89959.1 hypothetical protein [Acetivibrio sp.]HQA58695.1 hypothetical protein [Acetivibrio sp.]
MHIKTVSGFDEMQVARALIAQLIGFVLVSVIYFKKQKTNRSELGSINRVFE